MSAVAVILWAIAVLVVMFVAAVVLVAAWLAGEIVADAIADRRKAHDEAGD